MENFDILSDTSIVVDEPELLKQLINNAENVEVLWRLTDDSEPNYFTLRTMSSGKLEKYISLMDLLEDFMRANSEINKFDLFFAYMVRYVTKKDINNPEDKIILDKYLCLYLKISKLINLIRSTPTFLEKISYIKLTPTQCRKPYANHWGIYYSDPQYDKDSDLIELLMACAYKKELSCTQDEYLKYIYELNINLDFKESI